VLHGPAGFFDSREPCCRRCADVDSTTDTEASNLTVASISPPEPGFVYVIERIARYPYNRAGLIFKGRSVRCSPPRMRCTSPRRVGKRYRPRAKGAPINPCRSTLEIRWSGQEERTGGGERGWDHTNADPQQLEFPALIGSVGRGAPTGAYLACKTLCLNLGPPISGSTILNRGRTINKCGKEGQNNPHQRQVVDKTARGRSRRLRGTNKYIDQKFSR